MSTTELLHVMQASLQFSDPRKVQRRDLRAIYQRGADVIGHTEAGGVHSMLLDACEDFDYQLVQPVNPRTSEHVGTAIAVRSGIKIVDSSWLFVIPGKAGKASEGAHDARGVTTVELDWRSEDVFVSEVHMLTGWAGRDTARRAQIEQQWRTTTKHVARLARDYDLSVLMGDVNYDPDDPSSNLPSEILRQRGFVSAFDERGRSNAPTHGSRTIDQIYTLKRDRRLSVERLKVWPELGSDHRAVSAWLRIEQRKPRA